MERFKIIAGGIIVATIIYGVLYVGLGLDAAGVDPENGGMRPDPDFPNG